MAQPRIGEKPMTSAERSARKKRLDKERLARLQADNEDLTQRVHGLEIENASLHEAIALLSENLP